MTKSSPRKNNEWITGLIWKNKWLLIGSVVLAGLITYTTTRFITPRYTAVAIVYPAGEQGAADMKLKQGSTLLLLQLLESSFLRDSVITHFELHKVYGYDTSTLRGKGLVAEQFDKRTDYTRTLYKSVKIEVQDENPELAARLANGIVDISNAINERIYRENTRRSVGFFKEQYHQKMNEVKQLSQNVADYQSQQAGKAVNKIRQDLEKLDQRIEYQRDKLMQIRQKLQVHNLNDHVDKIKSDYDDALQSYVQAEAKLEAFSDIQLDDSVAVQQVLVRGYQARKSNLRKQLSALLNAESEYNRLTHQIALNRSLHDDLMLKMTHIAAEFEPEVNSLEMKLRLSDLEKQMEQLNKLKTQYEDALSRYRQPVPAAYVFSKAKPAYEPAYPRTLLFTAGAMFLTLIFVLSILLFIRGISKK